MAGQILVPLKRNDRIEDVIPYIEDVAKPGMRVSFFIPYPVEPWLWLRDHWVTTESPREAILAGRKITESYSWDMQRGLAERKVVLARQALHKKGVEVTVDVYTGSLKRVVESYLSNGDVQLIVMRARSRIMSFLYGAIPLFGLFKRPSFSPVLLVHHRPA